MENKWKQWISGFGKKGKLPAKQQLLILLLAGILLVVVVSPVPDQKDPEIGTGAGQEETETEGGEATEQQYERLLEKRVEDTLECVEGVGKVKVMITLKSSEEKVVEKDSQREENEITEEDKRLYDILIRFDAVYYFKQRLNRKALRDYDNLWNYAKELYSIPEYKEFADFEKIKQEELLGTKEENPYQIVGLGPDESYWNEPNNRAEKFA